MTDGAKIRLATAFVQIMPSMEGVKDSVTKELSGATSDAGAKSGSGFAGKFVKASTGVIAAGSAAVIGAASKVWSAASDVASAGDAIDKASQKMGVSAEQYQVLGFAAEHSGFSIGTFQTAARKLEGTEFAGNVWDAVEAIQAIEDPTERAAAASEMFGDKVAMEMAPLLNGTDTLTDYNAQLSELGGIMSDDAVSASAAFEDNLLNIQTAIGGLSTSMLSTFLPSMNTVMEGITDVISGDSGGMAKTNEGINSFLANMEACIPQVIDVVTSICTNLIDVFVQNLPQIVEMGMKLILQLGLGIMNAIPQLIAQLPAVFKAIMQSFDNMKPQLLEAGKNIVQGLWEGIKSMGDWLKSQFTSMLSGVVGGVKNFLGIHSPSTVFAEIGENMAAGMGVGFNKEMDSVRGTINSNLSFAATGSADPISDVFGLLSMYLPKLLDKQTAVTLDGYEIYKSVRDNNDKVRKSTGINPLLEG